jgi:hypothetical protein
LERPPGGIACGAVRPIGVKPLGVKPLGTPSAQNSLQTNWLPTRQATTPAELKANGAPQKAQAR